MFMEDRMLPKLYIYLCEMGFPGGLAVKNLPAVKELLETRVLALGWEDPRRRAWQSTPVFLPGESRP